MSLKSGLVEIKTHLCRTFVITRDGRNLQQGIITRCLTHQRTFNSVGQKNRISACSRNLIDRSQGNLHSANSKKEKLTASISEVEHNRQELPVIEPAIPHEKIILHLKDCKTVKEQMTVLNSLLRLTDEDVKGRMSICNDIQNMLQPFFKDFKLQLFGSSANGFGCKGCDIDMSFNAIVNPEDVMNNSFDPSDIPPLEDILSKKVSPKHVSRLSPKNHLRFIYFVFRNYYRDSIIAPTYIDANCPIVRFVNDKCNLKCDLSCGNTSLKNTKLLYLYGKMDERVTQLMIAIHYWAKHVGLIGPGLPFNTITISLMLIYYLQTRAPPVVPSAEYIFSVADSMMSDDVHDKSIFKDLEKIPPSKNTESVEDLFRGFFFYYLYFDFTKVICPLNASAVSREKFQAMETDKHFQMNSICVQDPVKLRHNVANSVDYQKCHKFGLQMLMTCKYLQDKTFWTPHDGDWGLLRIFHKAQHCDSNDEAFFNFEVPLHFCNSKRKQDVLQLSSDLVLKILKEALLFECDMILKTDESDFINDNLLFSTKCKALYNTWLGRNCVKADENLTDTLKKEHSVSLKLIDQKKEEKQKQIHFFCKGYVVDKNEQLSLHVKVIPVGKVEFSPILGIFLKEYIPRTMKKLWLSIES